MPNAERVDYNSTNTPSDYYCRHCGVRGVKLWREYQCFIPTLLCGDCALRQENKAGPLTEQGLRVGSEGNTTDQIGFYVPCVPNWNNGFYWGYTYAPPEGINWWRRLPLRKS